MIRRLGSVLAAAVLAVFVAAPVLAGGWATIVVDDVVPDPPPIEGGSVVIGFTVLQHGQTPTDRETPTVHLRNVMTGATVDVEARPSGPTGHYAATATIPAAGFWEWSVELSDLVTEPLASAPVLTVHDVTGTPPALDPATVLAAVTRARAEALTAVTTRLDETVAGLEAGIAAAQAGDGRLGARSAALDDRLAALEATMPDASASFVAVALVALLAGAFGGLAMTWVARRPTPRPVDISEATETRRVPEISEVPRQGSLPG